MTYQRDPWDKPPRNPNYYRQEPDPFESRWLREKRERETEAMRDLEKKIRHALNYGYNPYSATISPGLTRKEYGDYLIYYLGGPLNATQEYFWDKILPKDTEIRTIPEKEPICVDPATAPPPDQCVLRSNRYKIVVIPKFETPFSTVQVYLALYQEPPL